MLLFVLEGFAILMRSWKGIVQNIKIILVLAITSQVKKQFSDIKKLTREEAGKPKLLKTTFSTSCDLIKQYKPLFSNLKTIIRNHLALGNSDQKMLGIFLHNTISVTYKTN